MPQPRRTPRSPIRWHIAVFLAPAVLIYTAIMIIPLFGTLNLSLFTRGEGGRANLWGWPILPRCLVTRAGRGRSGTRHGTTCGFSLFTCWCKTPSALRWRQSCPHRACGLRPSTALQFSFPPY